MIPVPGGSHFTVYNLPLGIFRAAGRRPGAAMAIGDDLIDLRVLAQLGFLDGIAGTAELDRPSLNSLMAEGNEKASALRRKVQELLTDRHDGLPEALERAVLPRREADMLLPVEIGDYTDFYSSEEHATNVGRLFRDPENALLPNWKHLPVGYHGRASSIVVSGVPVRRPKGQVPDPETGTPVFGPSRKLDFELELAFFVGRGSELGRPVPIASADNHIFGYVLMNDWSARDIQQWEYRPLGPFLGKSFATSISPWIVLADALEPFRVPPVRQEPEVLPYLRSEASGNYDIRLEVEIDTGAGHRKMVTTTNSRSIYWTSRQQLAHHTVNGCNLKTGDLMASGTISGTEETAWGSLLERTYNGSRPLEIAPGVQRTFLEDGDTVIMTGRAGEGPHTVGFGELRNTVEPAIH